MMASDPWSVRDAKGRVRPAPVSAVSGSGDAPTSNKFGDFLPASFCNIVPKADESVADVPNTTKFRDEGSDAESAQCSESSSGSGPVDLDVSQIDDKYYEIYERILEESRTDAENRAIAEKLAEGMNLPWRPKAWHKRQQEVLKLADPSTLPPPSVFKFGSSASDPEVLGEPQAPLFPGRSGGT